MTGAHPVTVAPLVLSCNEQLLTYWRIHVLLIFSQFKMFGTQECFCGIISDSEWRFLTFYYSLRSSLQIIRSAVLDDGTWCAHYLTPVRTCCEGFYQNYSHSVFRLYIATEYNFTISVTQFALFRSLETVLVLYNLLIQILCFNGHVTCIHSNTCGYFDMIEPLDKTLQDFTSLASNVPSSNTAERRICRLDRNM